MRIIDYETNQEIENPDLEAGCLVEGRYAPQSAFDSIDNVTKCALDDDDFEVVRLYIRYSDDEIAAREEAQRMERREAMLAKLDQCFTEELIPSDKQGQLWNIVKLGDVEIMREYVDDPNYSDEADGSYLKPFAYVDGMTVAQGMFYTDGDDIWEAIADGVPSGFDDEDFFAIIR